jgi:hypothetical protein
VSLPENHTLAAARASRAALLATRAARPFELPLRFWRQQVHFTTPASGRPEKALSALAAVPRLLARFDLSVEVVAGHLGVAADVLRTAPDARLPAVLLDAEDAVAATDEAARQARSGAVTCFRTAAFASWGHAWRAGGRSAFSEGGVAKTRCGCSARPAWDWKAASTTWSPSSPPLPTRKSRATIRSTR